jgi:hypothetical protein
VKKADRDHLDRLAALCCIACRHNGIDDSPAEIHHLRSGVGKGQRSPHNRAIPLCPAHHRTGGHGVAFHAGKQAFEARFGTEEELLTAVQELMA